MAPLDMMSLHTAALQLQYERSCQAVNLILKDEEIRKTRFKERIHEDDANEARELLAQEIDRSSDLEVSMKESILRAEEAEEAFADLQDSLRVQQKEKSVLQVRKINLPKCLSDCIRRNAMRSST